MLISEKLIPAQQLVATNRAHYPNESAEYRAARNALLVEEIELRRQIERVAGQRRALPPGGQLAKDFEFISESGPTFLSALFGEKDTLMLYSMMYGPQRKGPCPSCTSFLSAWNGIAVNLRERVAIAVTARSPIERLMEYKRQRGFGNLPFVSDLERRVHPGLRQPGRRGRARIQRLHSPRRCRPALLQRRDERRDGGSWARSAGRTRS